MNLINKNLIIPFILIGSVFSVLGFTIGINAFFVPFVKQAFNITTTMSYLIMTATFSGFVIFGTFSQPIIKNFGYRERIVIAFFIMALGFFLIVPAAKFVSFPLLLLGLFVSGLGRALIIGAVQTYVAISGPPESATSRIALMGINHIIFYAVASLMLSLFMDLTDVRLDDVVFPFYIITGFLLFMSALFYFASLPDVKAAGEFAEGEDNSDVQVYGNSQKSIFHLPHLFLGILAIFFAVGIDMTTLGSINDFATRLNLPSPENYVWFVSAGMIIGFLFGILCIPKFISQEKALFIATLSGIFITLVIVIVPSGLSIYLVGVLGLANSMMVAIWPLALADLGKYTKRASSLLVTGFIGGALLPLLFGYLIEIASFQFAYILLLPAYLYIMYYALSGCKIRRQRIFKIDHPDSKTSLSPGCH